MTAACPACSAMPPPEDMAATPDLQFSLPTIHCAACIGKIERGLAKLPGIGDARVNLSMKRLSVSGAASAETIQNALQDLGFEAYPLDMAALDTATDRSGRDLMLRMAVAGFAMMNVMLLSVAVWSGAAGATRDLFHLISAAITIPVIAYSGQPFFRSALSALRVRALNMDVPISLAIILATGMSTFESLNGGRHAYFEAALSLTFFLLIGRYLDHRTRRAARSAAKELSSLEVHTARRLAGEVAEPVPTRDLRVGDRVLVATGERVPVDGDLLSGTAMLDRSFLTGESAAVDVAGGATLQAGEINLGAPIQVRATAVGEDTTLRQVAALVETAERGRNSYTALADRAAQIYAPAVHLLALFALLGWWAFDGDFRHALNVAIAVLIITCPCALGLAVPAVTTAAVSRLYSASVLVKHATALERLAEVDHIVFDKTGTLTLPSVAVPDALTKTKRGVCRALAQASHHPLSRALALELDGVTPAWLTEIEEEPGKGVRAIWRGKRVALGRADWLGAEFAGLGLRIGEGDPVALPTTEILRSGVSEALAHLNLPAEIVTGDSEAPAMALADQLGLPVTFGADPTAKRVRLETLKAEGHRVLMVGDGLNDTLALAEAHASVAPSSALDASRNAADAVLLGDSLADLPHILSVARATVKLSKQNFAIAALYNAIAVPIALAGFATPLAAALAMSASITVLLNSHRMRFVK